MSPIGPVFKPKDEQPPAEWEQPDVQVDQERAWRLEQLLKLRDKDGEGFDEEAAELLAYGGIDWHYAERLFEIGCPVGVAFRLLV